MIKPSNAINVIKGQSPHLPLSSVVETAFASHCNRVLTNQLIRCQSNVLVYNRKLFLSHFLLLASSSFQCSKCRLETEKRFINISKIRCHFLCLECLLNFFVRFRASEYSRDFHLNWNILFEYPLWNIQQKIRTVHKF